MKRNLNTMVDIQALAAFAVTLASRLALWPSFGDSSAWSRQQTVSSTTFTVPAIIHVALHEDGLSAEKRMNFGLYEN